MKRKKKQRKMKRLEKMCRCQLQSFTIITTFCLKFTKLRTKLFLLCFQPDLKALLPYDYDVSPLLISSTNFTLSRAIFKISIKLFQLNFNDAKVSSPCFHLIKKSLQERTDPELERKKINLCHLSFGEKAAKSAIKRGRSFVLH